jgi:hypothetical protein
LINGIASLPFQTVSLTTMSQCDGENNWMKRIPTPTAQLVRGKR